MSEAGRPVSRGADASRAVEGSASAGGAQVTGYSYPFSSHPLSPAGEYRRRILELRLPLVAQVPAPQRNVGVPSLDSGPLTGASAADKPGPLCRVLRWGGLRCEVAESTVCMPGIRGAATSSLFLSMIPGPGPGSEPQGRCRGTRCHAGPRTSAEVPSSPRTPTSVLVHKSQCPSQQGPVVPPRLASR